MIPTMKLGQLNVKMKESWELECAYRAVQRFRVIWQTANENSFIILGKLDVLSTGAAQ